MRPHRYPGLFSDPRNRGLWLAVGASALLHAGLMMAFGRFHIRPVERTFYAPMHMIDLVEPRTRPGPKKRHAPGVPPKKSPGPHPETQPATKAKAPAKPKPPPPKPPSATRPIPVKPTPAPAEPTEVLEERLNQRIARMREKAGTPPRTEASTPSRPGGGVDEAIERIRKRFDDAVPGGASGAIAARPSGNVMEQVRLRAYYNRVWEHVNGHWTIPPGVRGRDLSVIVSARIDRRGRVLSVVTEVPSASEAFNHSAVQALQRAEPLPAIPAMIPDATLEIGFRFHGE